MPSLFPSTLIFKSAPFPLRLHHHPFIHGRNHPQNPSHLPLPGPSSPHLLRFCGLLNRLTVFVPMPKRTRGSKTFAAEGWWSRPGFRCNTPMVKSSLGERNLVAGVPERGSEDQAQLTGSSLVQQRQNGRGEIGTNGNSSGKPEDEQLHSHSAAGLLTLPTVLTIARVAAVPLLVSTFYMNSSWATTATTSIFIVAAITDWLDGYIARKMQLRTTFGAFLDPVADKLMVAATLILLCTRPLEVAIFGEVPWLLTVPSVVIIGREITMSAVREWAASQNSKVLEAVAVNNLGKWKTATQMTALTILLATRDSSLTGMKLVVASGVSLLYISSGLAAWSLVVYTRKISGFLLK